MFKFLEILNLKDEVHPCILGCWSQARICLETGNSKSSDTDLFTFLLNTQLLLNIQDDLFRKSPF